MQSENLNLATKVPLPLGPFFLALSEKDLHITITDWERLHRVLACSGNWTLRRLRNVLTALLAKNEEQTIIFERCFDSYFGLVADCVPPDRDSINYFRALLTDRPTTGDRSVQKDPTVPQEGKIPSPPIDEPKEQKTWPRTLRFSDIWLALGKMEIITDDVQQLKYDEEDSLVWDPHLPHVFPWHEVGGQAPPRVDPATLDFLADCMGYYQTEAPSRRLDIIRSIQAGIEAGGLPRFIFEPARMFRTLVILEDMSARARQWNPVAAELARDMELHGITVLHGRFNTSPLHFITESGEILHLEDIEYDRTGAILLIFSDSKCLQSGDPELILEELRTWPNLAWLDLREPRSWDRPTFIVKRFGIDVYPASKTGIECAMRRFLTEEGSLPDWFGETRICKEHYRTDISLERYLAHILDRALPWAEACALLQPVGYGLAEKLREAFFPKIPAESIGRFHDLPGTTVTSEGIHFSDEVCNVLKRGFHDHTEPKLHNRILGFILHELKKIIDRLPTGTQDRPALASKLGDMCLWQLEAELKSKPGKGLTCNGMCDSCAPQLKGKCPERKLTELADQFPQLSPVIEEALEKLSDYKAPIQLPPPGMVLIPEGIFSMGDPSKEGYDSERPVHEVLVGAFYLDEYPVTGRLWREVYEWARSNGYTFDNEGKSRGPNHPVTDVSWYDVVKWANARSEMAGRRPVYYTDGGRREVYRKGRIDLSVKAVDWEADGFRLPTEAEWEKGARGGLEGRHYPWESKGKAYKDYISREKANYGGNEGGTTEVGRYAPNGYGLYDMAGNVREWCWDWYDKGWYRKSESRILDCRGPERGRRRVYRGGSWRDDPFGLRCAFRYYVYGPGLSIDGLGFRLAIGQLIARGRVQGSGPGARSRRQVSDRAQKKAYASASGILEFVTEPLHSISIQLTDSNGDQRRFTIAHERLRLPAGDWRMSIDADGYGQMEERVQVAAEVAKRITVRCVPGRLQQMVLIPEGVFSMGDPTDEGYEDECPVHEVLVGAFYLGEYPVTGRLWREVYEWARSNGYAFDNEGKSWGPNHPVTNVNWYDVVKWANARSEMAGRRPVYYTDGGRRQIYRKGRIDLSVGAVDWEADGFRLPTEAEWEKGARGGLEGRHYPWESKGKGYKDHISREKANYGGNEGGTTEVGRYAPNGYGLYDMAGNVWEWCWDWYDKGWYGKSESRILDCRGPEKGGIRVHRGGSWHFVPIFLRCAVRAYYVPGHSRDGLGFRLAIGQLIARGRVQGSGPGARSRRQVSDRAPKKPWWKRLRDKT